jgi:sugar phosphate isomerase/epimerase
MSEKIIFKNSRREFLATATSLWSLSLFPSIFKVESIIKKPLLAFSTLGCPKWSFEEIVKCAVQNGYDGIEIRGIKGELYLPKCPEFNNSRISETLMLVKDNNLKIVDLGTSTQLHHADIAKRKINLDEAKRFIDLAEKVSCPNIRVFPDDLPKNQTQAESIDLIISGLLELSEYAKGSLVNVLLESHGKVVQSDLLYQVMKSVERPNVGLIWDIFNMWSITKESPTEVHKKLQPYIRHIHVKDAIIENEKEKYVLLGEGEAPVKEALSVLRKSDFQGYYSFEWEKMWHPDIQEPEIAIPHFSKKIKDYW